MNLEIGNKYKFRTEEGDFLCEVISHTDSRLKKPAFKNDVCLYFPEIDWANTYDIDVVLPCLMDV